MAISVLDATPAAISAAGTTFAFQPGISAMPGDVLLVIIAQDNGGTNGAQSMSAPTMILQAAGKGTVTQRRAQNYDPGAIDAGITQGIYEIAITAPFEMTDWLQANSSASDQIGVHVVRLRPDPGFALSFGAQGGTTGSSTNAPTTTTGSITSGDVVVGAYAGETNESITGDSDTSNGSWSTLQQATANTGTVGTSVRVAAQWKVVTGTATQTYNVSNTTAANAIVGYVTYTQVAAARAVTGWRWYADAAGLGSALAAENTIPTLSAAQNKNTPLRLRAMLRASANLTEALSLQYKTDNSGTWTAVPASGSTLKDWPRYANGADTAGGTVTRVLTGADTNGVYIEATASSQTVNAADSDKEFDFSISFRYLPPNTRLWLRINGAGGAWQANGLNCIAVDSPDQADWEDNTGTKSAVSKIIGDAAGADARNFESYRPKGIYDGTRWWIFYQNADSLTTIRYRYWDGTSAAWSAEATRATTAASKQSDVTAAFYNDSGTLRVFVALSSSTTVTKIHRGSISGTTITWDSEASLTTATADSSSKMGIAVDQGGFVWIHGQSATELYAYRSTSAATVTAFGSKITNAQSRTLGGYSDHTFAIPSASNEVVIFRITGGTSTGLLYSSIFTGTATAEVAVNPSGNVHNTDWGVCRNPDGDIYCVYSNGTATGDTGTLTLRVSQDKGATWTTCTSPSVTMDGTSTDGMFVTDDGARGCYIWYTSAEASSGGNNTQITYKHYTVTGSAVTTGTWDSPTVLFGQGMGNGDAFWAANLGGSKILAFHERGDDDANTTLEFFINYGALSLASPDGTATPAALALTVSTPAPTVSGESSTAPSALALTATMPSPTTTGGSSTAPASVALTATKPAPTATGGSNSSPAAAALAVSTPAPTATGGGGDGNATPSAVALTATMPAPTAAGGSNTSPSAAALTTTTPAPTVTGGSNVTPTALTLAATMPAPTTTGSSNTSPTAKALTSTTPAPTTTGAAATSPAALALTTSTPAPAATGGSSTSPAAVALATTTPAPTATGTASTTPSALTLAATMPAPTTTGAATTAPAAAALSTSTPTPSVSGGATTTPSAVALTVSTPAPSATGGSAGNAAPATLALTTSLPAASASGASDVSPAAVALSVTANDATATGGATSTPAAVQLAASLPAPAVSGGGAAVPPAAALAASTPAPTVTGAANTAPPALALTVSTPDPTATGGAGGDGEASPSAKTLSATTPAPTVTGGAGASPSALTLTVSFPTPAPSGGAVTTPATLTTLTLTATTPAPTAAGGAGATPGTASITVTIPAITGTGGAVVSPAALLLAATFPAVLINTLVGTIRLTVAAPSLALTLAAAELGLASAAPALTLTLSED